MVQRFPIDLVQPIGSSSPEVRLESEPSGSSRSCGGGVDVVETSSRSVRVTRSAAKQTSRGATPLPKRSILSPARGSSSKRPKN